MNLVGLTKAQSNSLIDWLEDKRSIELFFPVLDKDRTRLCERLVTEDDIRESDKIRGQIRGIDAIFRLHDELLDHRETLSEENPLDQEEVT